MRLTIAVMMRAMDKEAGFRALTQGLVEGMLRAAPDVSFLLIHQTDKWMKQFEHYPNARAVLARMPSYLLWDQIAVPWAAWRMRANVIFNPKFFVPMISPCPVTMGLQEPSWFTRPDEYGRGTRWYQKVMIPLSIRRCAHVFPNSQFILDENRAVLKMPIAHATIQYSAADARFRPEQDADELAKFRSKYQLPQPIILVVSRAVHPETGDIFAGKSPEVAYRAFNRISGEIPHHLVFAGRGIERYLRHTEGNGADFRKVTFIEFVPFEELHLLFNLAEMFVNPCTYEGCPNTVLQAMACGVPTIVAASGGSADVGEGAALMAIPMDDQDLSQKMSAVACNESLRRELGERSLQRSRFFSWDKTALQTIDALRRVAADA